MPDDKPQPPDMDLIRMVQQARLQNDRQAVPSQVSGVYWIEAKAPDTARQPTTRAGNWFIETHLAAVDNLWEKVRSATLAGALGYKSKVSTAPGKAQPDADTRLICVSTYDATDTADVERVWAALAALGIVPSHYQ